MSRWNSAPYRWPKSDEEMICELEEEVKSLRDNLFFLSRENGVLHRSKNKCPGVLWLKCGEKWYNTNFDMERLYSEFEKHSRGGVIEIQTVDAPIDFDSEPTNTITFTSRRFGVYSANSQYIYSAISANDKALIPGTGFFHDADEARWW